MSEKFKPLVKDLPHNCHVARGQFDFLNTNYWRCLTLRKYPRVNIVIFIKNSSFTTKCMVNIDQQIPCI